MIFKYRARTESGQINNGTREADSESEAISWIREQGWSPIMIEAGPSAASMLAGINSERASFLNISLFKQKITMKDKNIVFKQMSTMVNSGITVAATLDLLASQTENKTLGRVIGEMRDAVGGGVTLAASMARHPDAFSNLEVALVRAGEEGGVLDICMERLAVFVEKQYMLQKKIKSAMIYPSVIVSVTILAIGLLCAFIVPMFRKAFANIGMKQLPALTSAIFTLSDFLRGWWFTLPIPFIIIFLLFKFVKKTPGGRRFLDGRKIKAPIFGDIIFKGIMARSFRTFATLVAAGVSVLDSIEMAAAVSDNVIVGEAFTLMRERAQNGVMISTTIREQNLFPAMVGHMLAVGEETGNIDEVLTKVADWYDMELDEQIKSLTSIIEPVVIVMVGVVVGLVVGSIFVPLLQSMQQFM
jgi:type IV pilus assembly protein PilC